VRGWDKLPAYVNQNGARAIKAKYARQAEAAKAPVAGAPASIEGDWKVTVKGPTGPMDTALSLKVANGVLGGTQSGEGMTNTIEEITYDSKTGDVVWSNKISKPIKMTLKFTGKVESAGQMNGKVKAGFMGTYPFTGVKT
jgi:hypothetical protein